MKILQKIKGWLEQPAPPNTAISSYTIPNSLLGVAGHFIVSFKSQHLANIYINGKKYRLKEITQPEEFEIELTFTRGDMCYIVFGNYTNFLFDIFLAGMRRWRNTSKKLMKVEAPCIRPFYVRCGNTLQNLLQIK